MLFTIHDSKPSCYSTLLALIAGRETPQNLYQTTLRQISSVVNLKSCTESVMARHVGAAAVSRVLRVRTRFESRMGMRYSTNALNRFHLSLSLSLSVTHTTTAPSPLFVIQLVQLHYRF